MVTLRERERHREHREKRDTERENTRCVTCHGIKIYAKIRGFVKRRKTKKREKTGTKKSVTQFFKKSFTKNVFFNENNKKKTKKEINCVLYKAKTYFFQCNFLFVPQRVSIIEIEMVVFMVNEFSL